MAHAKHYETVSEIYDRSVFYDISGPLVQWQLKEVSDKLHLQPGDRVADVGGGTGAFTSEIARWLREQNVLSSNGAADQAQVDSKLPLDELPPVTLVEPSAEMLDQARSRGGDSLRLRLGSATDFTSAGSCQKEAGSYDKILLKEVIHHIPQSERSEVFRGMHELLSPGGQLCVLTRPRMPNYPLFDAAMQHWVDHQDDLGAAEKLLLNAGFDVATHTSSFPIRLAKSSWYEMVRQRFWSCFAHFSDMELEAGIGELEEKFPDSDQLLFDEVEIFIVGTKPNP